MGLFIGNTIIASAATGSNFDTSRHMQLVQQLRNKGYDFEVVEGVYKGNGERSVMLKDVPYWCIDGLIGMFCQGYQQECILLVREDDTSSLLDLTSSTPIGIMHQVSKEVARQQEASTTVGNKFYAVH